jgi:mono/diheme cytochrome c family protein
MVRTSLASLFVLSAVAGAAHLFAQDTTTGSTQTPAAPSAQTPQTPAAVPPGNAGEGRKIYVSHGCYQCHGFEGQGSVAGPRLGPRPAPYPYFSSYIRKPTLLMPPYTAKVLSDQNVADIYAFLQARPAPVPLEKLEMLK